MKNNPSAKEIYFWNLLGNIAAAAVSVVYLLIVTRLQTAELADQYSLATSIGNLWVIIGLFQVRNYQGTDVKGLYSFENYFSTRLLTIFLMLVTIVPYLYLIRYDMSLVPLAIMLLLIAYRTSDALSDVFQGLFQQERRLDIAGKSMVYRYSLSVLALLVSLLLTNSLVLSLLFLALVNFIFVYVYDYQRSKQFAELDWIELYNKKNRKANIQIIKVCFPLFFYGFILNQIFNEPRLVIAAQMQKGLLESGLQRDYNILFMPVFFMSLCVLIIRPLITDLAKLWHQQNLKKFAQILRKMFFILLTLGAIVTTLSFFLGAPILSLVFGVDLSKHVLTLTVLVFAGVLYSIAVVFENILTIFRKHSYLLVIYLLMLLVSKLITESQVEMNGLLGAAISFMLVMVIYAVGSFIIFILVRRGKR